tara:strand:- start:1919 stop:2764 length:846 start_codon:yes stop_codon:yes gene_type:complete
MKWFLKILLKLFISRLPIAYSFWKITGIFKHGKMDSYEYAIKIFELHFNRAFPKNIPSDLRILELGPGDSIASAIIGFAYGAKCTYLVDVNNYATKNLNFYKNLILFLKARGLETPNISNATSIKEILKSCNGIYLTEGLSSLKSLENNSIDFVWSHSVLEHIRKYQFYDTQKELIRILKPSGLVSHSIDFQDHLNYALNNLRFSEKIWESNIFVNSGFYTNRIPAVKMNKIFIKVGFKLRRKSFGKWKRLPTKRSSIHKDFDIYTDKELLNRTSYVLLEK